MVSDILLWGLQIPGGLALAVVAVKMVRWGWLYLWLPYRFSRLRLSGRYGPGSWALITGAGDGLGKAFARALAAQGFNLILVSRTAPKLEKLQGELQAQGVRVQIAAIDLAQTSLYAGELLAGVVGERDLSMLVNCAGATVHRRFADVPTGTLRHLLALNVETTATVTHALLPFLLHHHASTGHRAALLNVGSIVGRFYWPGTQLYGACKSFIDHLTVPLACEYRDQLDVLSYQPTVMSTSMATGTEPAAITIAPRLAAQVALAQLGHTVASHGHWRHGLLAAVLTLLPSVWRDAVLLSEALEMGKAELARAPSAGR